MLAVRGAPAFPRPLEIGREFCSALAATKKPSGRTSALTPARRRHRRAHLRCHGDPSRSLRIVGRPCFAGVPFLGAGKDTGIGPRCPGAVRRRPEIESASVCLLVYGEKRANAGLAAELELDGYVVHRASHPATVRERCTPGAVDLVIFGQSPHRGFDVLRALRAGELAPGAAGVRVLWLSASREPATMSVLRAFEAGADDVARTPHGYAELLARVRALLRRHSLIAGLPCWCAVRSRSMWRHARPRSGECPSSFADGVRAARPPCARPDPRP